MSRTLQQWVRACVLAAGMLCAACGSARAGITVTSFTTTADTNAYAPFSKAQYYQEQVLTNTSPAVADVSADWTGTNVGGTTNTWHWVGASHLESTTTFDANSLSITGTGSFSFVMTTTSDFVDPIHSGGVFTPGGDADYECQFTLDVPATFRTTGQLNGPGVIALSSSEAGEIFFVGGNSGSFDRMGTIAPGHYGVRLNPGIALGQLPNGVNHRAARGTFLVPSFTVTVPEPELSVTLIGAPVIALRTQRLRKTPRARSCATSRQL